MKRSSVLLLLLTSFMIVGCGDMEPPPPPVKNALTGLEEMKEAEEREAAERLQRAMQIRSEAKKNVEGPAEGIYQVRFDTTVGQFTVEVDRSLAPVGAERFYQLVRNGFYDDAAFFRVVPKFVVQFGIAADPEVHKKWTAPIPDDPVVASNKRGTITFATSGPDSRTTQVFINYEDNSSSLDSQGFAPFGRVIEGMDVVDRINSSYGERPQQPMIEAEGNAYLQRDFPNLDYIRTVSLIQDDQAADNEEQVGRQPSATDDADSSSESKQVSP